MPFHQSKHTVCSIEHFLSMSAVVVKELTKIYGTQKAVDALSFELRKGEIVGFLGPNGAGKTTTMKVLTTFVLPDSGRVEVAGFDVLEQPMEVRRRIGYLPEHNPLYKEMYVREYLQFVAGLHRLPKARQRVDEMISLTGLEREQGKLIGALSKGYRQRVGLAQALIHDPEVLILDEPTSGLDPNQVVEIRELIARLGKEKTVLFSSHIMQEVEALCHRVLVINRGKLVADAPIDELRLRTNQGLRITLGFAQVIRATDLEALPGVREVHDLGDNRYVLFCESDLREQLFFFVAEKKWPLIELRKDLMELESVFQELTQSTD